MGEATKGARIIGAEREQLITTLCKNYEQGASLRDLARETGRSYGFVHDILTGAGVTLRGRGGSRRTPRK